MRSKTSDTDKENPTLRAIVSPLFFQSSKAPKSGYRITLRPLRHSHFSALKFCLPPVASHTYSGITPLHIMAVFSLSTRHTVASGRRNNRCSPNKHCDSSHESGNSPDFLSCECTQFTAPSQFLIRFPVSGLYCIILPPRKRLCQSSCQKITAPDFVQPK